MERTHTGTKSTQKRPQGPGIEPTTFLLCGNNAGHRTDPAYQPTLNSAALPLLPAALSTKAVPKSTAVDIK